MIRGLSDVVIIEVNVVVKRPTVTYVSSAEGISVYSMDPAPKLVDVVSLRGPGLHTGLIVEVASFIEDAPIESEPAGFSVTASSDTGIDVRIPADRTAGRVYLVLSDGDEMVSSVEIVLEVDPR